MEVKKSKNPAHATKNFGTLGIYEKKIMPGLIVCMSDELLPYDKTAWYCPIWAL